MKLPTSRAVVGIAVLSLGLSGCGLDQHPAYSTNVKYGLRTDPIVRDQLKLGDERFEPDRPGLMPIMKLEDFRDPDHPYYPKSEAIDDKVLRDPRAVPMEQRKEMEDYLEVMFGTPAAPKVNAKEAGLDEKAIAELKLDDATLAMGSTRYRIHCLHCHGVPGDGRGPTARWINPHPRDFRSGMFKFASVDRTAAPNRPPSRADLVRTLRQGIEGTAMPTFNLLSDDELESLVSYVIHLSVRGHVELTLFKEIFEPDPGNKNALRLAMDQNDKKEDIKANVKDYTKQYVKDGWLVANNPDKAIKVAPYPFDEKDPEYYTKILPASVKRGQEIFIKTISQETREQFGKKLMDRMNADKKFAAAESGALAAAEAQAVDAAKAKAGKELSAEEQAKIKEAAKKSHFETKANNLLTSPNCVNCHADYGRQAKYRYDLWGTLVRPNNLTLGVLRGGKRPVDIYYRVHSGITGSLMTPFGDSPFKGNEDYLWDVVNFVSVLPYPGMREKLGVKID